MDHNPSSPIQVASQIQSIVYIESLPYSTSLGHTSDCNTNLLSQPEYNLAKNIPLTSLAKSGLPTRAEITDAAIGYRAECVMLNKGTHILEAVKILSGLLRVEERHHIKKRDVFTDFTKQYGTF